MPRRMADDEPQSPWPFIPVEMLAHVFSFLSVKDRVLASRVCKNWAATVSTSYVWRYTEISFEDESPSEMYFMLMKFLHCMEHIWYLKMVLDQARNINRRGICDLLEAMADRNCKLRSLRIVCAGTSPFFYSGQDILQGIRRLCYNPDNTALQHLDFRGMPFLLDNNTVWLMTAYSPHLRTFLINNHAAGVNMLKPDTVADVLIHCPKLSTLGVTYVLLSVKMFRRLLHPDREPFKYLDIYYNGMNCHIPDEIWAAMAERHPKFRVGIEFAAVVHVRKMAEMFRPSIPVSTLHFNNFAYMVDQLGLAARYYSQTLEVLELFAIASSDLNLALIELAKRCVRLREIHCYCGVSTEVVSAFIQHCPNLKKYTLPTTRWYGDNPPTVYL
ncbi:F-box/LRR-repeat protein 8-like isoform X2 [Sceloporus undulatus]|uniref:F-box/LRR-repeat protein 8-like isoform X2 n=1 Tax=Sceloporus undulatus TaxID=8520 RepID=UPI001C4BFA49|nr:F-box/LRR-repeat protein 8-like isoform X2 [Sceloporus undulatus]XP_042294679.1 F-box/LRR-repeat protein 8-like isoform X2 [Sceloporus undulatus]XP_042294680.1 F-box/LRR-repeat protein 8-like isoform X2 [Sceloporus undulatus]